MTITQESVEAILNKCAKALECVGETPDDIAQRLHAGSRITLCRKHEASA